MPRLAVPFSHVCRDLEAQLLCPCLCPSRLGGDVLLEVAPGDEGSDGCGMREVCTSLLCLFCEH